MAAAARWRDAPQRGHRPNEASDGTSKVEEGINDKVLVLDTKFGRSLREIVEWGSANAARLFLEVDDKPIGIVLSVPAYELLKAAAELAHNPERLNWLLNFRGSDNTHSVERVFSEYAIHNSAE